MLNTLVNYNYWNSKITVFKIAIPFPFLIVTGSDNVKITPIKSYVSSFIIENNEFNIPY